MKNRSKLAYVLLLLGILLLTGCFRTKTGNIMVKVDLSELQEYQIKSVVAVIVNEKKEYSYEEMTIIGTEATCNFKNVKAGYWYLVFLVDTDTDVLEFGNNTPYKVEGGKTNTANVKLPRPAY